MKNFLLILCFFAACKSKQIVEETNSDTIPITDTVASVDEIEPQAENNNAPADTTIQITDNDFAWHPFEKDFEGIISNLGDYELEKEPYDNLHIEGQVDTIFHFRFDDSSLDYYKDITADGTILTADIRSQQVAFKKNLTLGMTLDAVIELFNTPGITPSENVSHLLIMDEDELNSVHLFFQDKKLARLKYEGYFD